MKEDVSMTDQPAGKSKGGFMLGPGWCEGVSGGVMAEAVIRHVGKNLLQVALSLSKGQKMGRKSC